MAKKKGKNRFRGPNIERGKEEGRKWVVEAGLIYAGMKQTQLR